MDCRLPGISVHGNSPGKNTGLVCQALLQKIFSTQGSNPGLPHCRWILYLLSHQGSLQFLPLWNGNSIYLISFLWGLNLKMNVIFSSVLAHSKWVMFIFEKLFLIFTRSHQLYVFLLKWSLWKSCLYQSNLWCGISDSVAGDRGKFFG